MHVNNLIDVINYFLILMLPDRVFGPTTTTRHVYDVAAQHVVSGAMEGINGSSFWHTYFVHSVAGNELLLWGTHL